MHGSCSPLNKINYYFEYYLNILDYLNAQSYEYHSIIRNNWYRACLIFNRENSTKLKYKERLLAKILFVIFPAK